MTPETFLKSFRIRYDTDSTAMVYVDNKIYLFAGGKLNSTITDINLIYAMDNYFFKSFSLKFLKDYYPK